MADIQKAQVEKTPAEVGTEVPKWLHKPLLGEKHNLINNRWMDTDTTPEVFYARVEELKVLQIDEATRTKLMAPFREALLAEIRGKADGLAVLEAVDIERIEKSKLLPEVSAADYAEAKNVLSVLKKHGDAKGKFRTYIKLDKENRLTLKQDNLVVNYGVDALFKGNISNDRGLLGNTGTVRNYDLKIAGDYPNHDEVFKAMEKFKRDTEIGDLKSRLSVYESGSKPSPDTQAIAERQKAEAAKVEAKKAAAKVDTKANVQSQLQAEAEAYIASKKPMIKAKLAVLVANKVFSEADMQAIIDDKPENTVQAVKNLQKVLKLDVDESGKKAEPSGKFTGEVLVSLINKANSLVIK